MATPVHLQTLSDTPSTLGRFELKKVLGRGAQAGVWLAHDPHLQRDVALKLLHAPADGSLQPTARQWLTEARNTGRLAHPHIVTLYEADVYDGRPGLVLELVNGPSLAQRLQQVGALPVEQAVPLMLQVLDALHHAHQQGVVHRDLKPSNILLDASGNAKVTDFGIAARLDATTPAQPPSATDGTPRGVEGTPGYLSPEAARGEAPQPVHDLFAAGLVLAEMLLGQPLLAEKDPYRAVYRVAHEDLVVPHNVAHPIDDGLHAVLQRALARDPSLRFASAADMAEALRAWASTTANGAPGSGEGAGNATLEFLLRRMRRTSDFPAMSAQILRVQSMAASENESLNGLTSEILKDVALTHKLLRIVNSAHFSHVGAGSINTVSRAVSLVGMAGIRNVAMSLVLLDHMENKGHANQLKGEFLRSLLAASLASELGPPQRDGEEMFIGALFQNLGRMLTEFYFPDEAQQVRRAMAPPHSASEERASTAVLGISYEALGQGIGKAWGLPATMLRLMRKPGTQPPGRVPTDPAERMHWQTLAANELADVFLKAEEHEVGTQLKKVATRYASCLGQPSDEVVKQTLAARDKLAISADAIGLRVAAPSPAARLLRPGPVSAPARSALGDHTLQANAEPTTQSLVPASADAAAPSAAERANQAASMLATGVQDITNAMVADEFKLNDVLRMILETMYRAMGFRQVLFCLKDAHGDTLVGRLGLGDGATEAARHFKVGLREPNNLFAVVCNKGLDTLIHDAQAPKVASNLPAWYHQHIHARSFMLLPLLLKGAPLGLIYADQMQADSIVLDDKGLALLKTLRNQAVMAFRQARGG
ncbi:MAG: HDOD domain-containing protein [Burkholderiaceae bacterium]